MKRVFEKEFFGKKLVVETGEIAKQADGAVFVRLNDTVVLSTACCSDEPKEGDFFPLTVTYEEKQYAIGRIPGGFLRREGRPGEHATLTARLIDRPIRPMFSDGFRNEVQIINTVMSVDLDSTPEMTAMFGSSLALGISDIPFDGPIAGVYVGRVNGKLIINPTVEEREISDLNLAVAGTKDAINMVEAGANELSEDEMLDAIMFGHEAIKALCEFEEEIIREVGKPKREIQLYTPDQAIVDDIYGRIYERMVKAISIFDKLDTVMEIDGETMKLTGEVILKDHLFDQTIKIMVQNGEGYTPDQYGEDVTGTMSNPADTPRENYDFTFAIESDTQYYNEDFDGNPVQDVDGNYQYQLDIHNWLIANRERMNIQYLFHDGDIIDDEDQGQEWINADNAYKMLDDANIPYGVLAGNHDVGHLSGDYTSFSKYFGEDRYNQNPWYGESYQDNRGHYDLITVDGIDFIMVYMGWGIGDQEIQWMNDVLARYPERKAILNFHEYLLASGGLGEEPQRIYNEVVAVNPNVCMVLSGHYHNAQTVVSQFDDNHDGVNDRNVYQMLFDYQGLAQGGMGYMRLMHFDNTNGQIIIRTYSPSLDDYNAKDESNIGDVANINGEEEFVINYSDLGITPVQKQIETTNLDVNIYNDDTFGTVNDVRSNQEISYTLENAPHGLFGWYVEISDANGGLTRSNVNYVNIDKHNIKPTIVLPDDEFNKIAVGTDFDPLKDVKAYDSQGNDLTSQIVVLGSVDVDKAGRYELTYQVADSFNNVTIVTRVVEVVENDDDQDINVQPGDDSNPNGTTGTNGTTSASVNTPFTGDLVNSNYLTLAIASLMTFILMIKKYLKDLKNNH